MSSMQRASYAFGALAILEWMSEASIGLHHLVTSDFCLGNMTNNVKIQTMLRKRISPIAFPVKPLDTNTLTMPRAATTIIRDHTARPSFPCHGATGLEFPASPLSFEMYLKIPTDDWKRTETRTTRPNQMCA